MTSFVLFIICYSIIAATNIPETSCRQYYPSTTVFYGDIAPRITSLVHQTGFGFHNHGYLSLELYCPPRVQQGVPENAPSIILFLCVPNEDKDSTERTIDMEVSHMEQSCRSYESSTQPFRKYNSCGGYNVKCVRYVAGTCVKWQREAVISRKDEGYYEFYLLQCPGNGNGSKFEDISYTVSPVVCQGNLTLLNDGGSSHLGAGEEQLVFVYPVLLFVWTVVFLVWITNWIKYRQYSNPLHKLLIISPSFKYVVLVLSIVQWNIIAKTGYEQPTLRTAILVVSSAEDATLFMTLMLAAEGWCVMRPHIGKVKHALIPVLFLVFLASVVCVIWIHSYFMAFAICSIVFVIYRALKWCSFNLDTLNKQIFAVRQLVAQKELRFQGLSIVDQLNRKRDIYIRLRMVIAMYTMVFAIITTMSTFLSEYRYIQILSFEIPEFTVYLLIWYIFRLRDFRAYEEIEVVVPKENSVIIFLPYPHLNWPKRQKLILGVPIEDETGQKDATDEKKTLLDEGS